MSDHEHRAAPSAASLIEAMRDIGYTLESALADVIDNAISAGATTIQIVHDIDEQPFIAVIDDGSSMKLGPTSRRNAARLDEPDRHTCDGRSWGASAWA